ncbi:MAG: tetratricopeptide repeat protein [Magnetococcales bacterium]|nr:tetratricopeptide repeat protein [Magnetococcales bacterium]
MSMLLKALESVEQDRKKQNKKTNEGALSQQFDKATRSDSGGFATPPDEMSLEFEPGGGLEIKKKEEKAFEDEGIETLEFEPVKPPIKSINPEPQEISDQGQSKLSGLAFDMDDEVVEFETTSNDEPPATQKGNNLSNLAFAMEEVEEEAELPAAGGSKLSGLAFAMEEDEEEAEQEVQADTGGSKLSGLAFAMEENEEEAEQEVQADTGGSKLSGLAFAMEEDEDAEPEAQVDTGGSKLSGLAFAMEEDEEAEPEAQADTGGSKLSGLAFAMEEDEEETEPPAATGGSKLSGLAFAMEEEEEAESPPHTGGSKLSGLAFTMEEDVDNPQPANETEPPAPQDGNKQSGLTFALEEEVEEPKAAIKQEPLSEIGSSTFSSMAIAMEEEAVEPDTELGPANDGSLLSSLSFGLGEVAKQETGNEPTNNGSSTLTGLGFDIDEVEDQNANGSGLFSDLAFGMDEVKEPASKGDSLLSDFSFGMDENNKPKVSKKPKQPAAKVENKPASKAAKNDEIVEQKIVDEPETAAKSGGMISGSDFEIEEKAEPQAASIQDAPAISRGMISSSSFEAEELVDINDKKDDATNPVEAATPSSSEIIAEEDEEDEDATNPIVTEQKSDHQPAQQTAMAEDDFEEDTAEDGWDASGDLDKTSAFNPAFLANQPKESKPKKLYGDAAEDNEPEDQSTKYGTKEHAAKQESLQQKAKTIFEATSKTVLPLKKYGMVAGAILLVGGGGFFAYQTFLATPTSQFPKQPPRVMRPIVMNPAAQKPAKLVAKNPGTNVTKAENPASDPQENMPQNQEETVAVLQDFKNASSIVREDTTFEPIDDQQDYTHQPDEVSHDMLVDAQAAYYSGEIEDSSELFKKVLRNDKHNRDAMMGLAAVAVRSGEHDKASGFYQKMLRENPKDSLALAGLVGLRAEVDPLARESQIKNLLLSEPNAHHLHFALGSLYAVQKRWGVAQKAFFKAYSISATNPDYAFNLAVSMDHLGHVEVAKKYYQTALALLTVRPGNFNKSVAEDRLAAFRQINKVETAPNTQGAGG